MCQSTDNTRKGQGGDDDGGIVIRHYKDEDQDQVHKLFQAGMMSLVPNLFWKSVLSPVFVVVTAVAAMLVLHVSLSLLYTILTIFGMMAILYSISYHAFYGYVQGSIKDDLSKIQEVYIQPGGCFLVAVDSKNGNIVGCVAGEKKGDHKYELRRMSVSKQIQGRGLAKRLIRRLEQECGKKGMLFLTTSYVQYAAIGLYKKHGFQLKKTITYQEGMFRFLSTFELYYFEKELKWEQIIWITRVFRPGAVQRGGSLVVFHFFSNPLGKQVHSTADQPMQYTCMRQIHQSHEQWEEMQQSTAIGTIQTSDCTQGSQQ